MKMKSLNIVQCIEHSIYYINSNNKVNLQKWIIIMIISICSIFIIITQVKQKLDELEIEDD